MSSCYYLWFERMFKIKRCFLTPLTINFRGGLNPSPWVWLILHFSSVSYTLCGLSQGIQPLFYRVNFFFNRTDTRLVVHPAVVDFMLILLLLILFAAYYKWAICVTKKWSDGCTPLYLLNIVWSDWLHLSTESIGWEEHGWIVIWQGEWF